MSAFLCRSLIGTQPKTQKNEGIEERDFKRRKSNYKEARQSKREREGKDGRKSFE